jgi:hypothetical protein
MTCYARPLAFLLLITGTAMIAAGMASFVVSALAVMAVSLLGTAMSVRIIVRTRRERAASGACTTCRHPCQGRPVVLTDETALIASSRSGAVTFLGPADLRSDRVAVSWPYAGQLRSREGSRS